MPAESDFREAWRYRDWVVDAFNRDLPYTDSPHQIAGDLLPPPHPGGINTDGLVATGLLAIADFVPGDVDKEQMIADYVNDQIDVVSRAFLGLTIACARCHDHKFDPISTEDYYALAGIFFSTRLIPGPVPGNTPLVRVPLLSPDELARVEAQDAAEKRRRAELEQQLPDAADRAYVALLPRLLVRETARYLVAASEYRQAHRPDRRSRPWPKRRSSAGSTPGLLAGLVDYLGRVAGQPSIGRHPILCDIASGSWSAPRSRSSAMKLQDDLAALAARKTGRVRPFTQGSGPGGFVPDPHACRRSASRHRRDGRVTLWPNRSGLPADARPVGNGAGSREDQRRDQRAHQDGAPVRRPVPARAPAPGARGTAACSSSSGPPTRSRPGQRLLGWEDSDIGKHGLGLMLEPGGRCTRSCGTTARRATWSTPARPRVSRSSASPGARGARRCIATGRRPAPRKGSMRSPPTRPSRRCGWADRVPAAAPGSGAISRRSGSTTGNWTRPSACWSKPSCEPPGSTPPLRKRLRADPLAELYEELLSARGPFWLPADERRKHAPRRRAVPAGRAEP